MVLLSVDMTVGVLGQEQLLLDDDDADDDDDDERGGVVEIVEVDERVEEGMEVPLLVGEVLDGVKEEGELVEKIAADEDELPAGVDESVELRIVFVEEAENGLASVLEGSVELRTVSVEEAEERLASVLEGSVELILELMDEEEEEDEDEDDDEELTMEAVEETTELMVENDAEGEDVLAG
ncbi:hypothetical protein IMSHALPRED_004024 [Imshaugia aleurites]|uniref:Uncharacterized protein n=1 Tax=Imshaugia aleurites TaxID=172621 RepID=A0A8H3EIP2_9LECA|nr:hypothetical protein IMSHALPRED_004024 [Imshaugia aleurites]